jgi:hypothetical protein
MRNKKTKAQIFIVVVITLAITLTVGIGFLSFTRSATQANQAQLDSIQANYLLKSGIEVVRRKIRDNFTNYTDEVITYGAGSITIDVEPDIGADPGQLPDKIRDIYILAEQKGRYSEKEHKKFQEITTGGGLRTCFVANAGNWSVEKKREDGQWLGGAWGINEPHSVDADPNTGECWVAATCNHQVIRLPAEPSGEDFDPPVWTVGGYGSCPTCFDHPWAVSVNPNNQHCWVADRFNHRVVRLDANGNVAATATGFNEPVSVSVDPNDNACWVADRENTRVVKVNENGSIKASFWNVTWPADVSVDINTGECWVADCCDDEVLRLRDENNGTISELVRVGEAGDPIQFNSPESVSADPAGGGCWVADTGHDRVVKLNADGSMAFPDNDPDFDQPVGVSVDNPTSACWVVCSSDPGSGFTIKLIEADGSEAFKKNDWLSWPLGVIALPGGGSQVTQVVELQ